MFLSTRSSAHRWVHIVMPIVFSTRALGLPMDAMLRRCWCFFHRQPAELEAKARERSSSNKSKRSASSVPIAVVSWPRQIHPNSGTIPRATSVFLRYQSRGRAYFRLFASPLVISASFLPRVPAVHPNWFIQLCRFQGPKLQAVCFQPRSLQRDDSQRGGGED